MTNNISLIGLQPQDVAEVSEVFDARFKTPLRCILIGGSFSGKSSLIKEIIDNDSRILTNKVDRILYFSKHYDLRFSELQKRFGLNFQYIKDLPEKSFASYLNDSSKHTAVILDDLQEEASTSSAVADLFAIYSRHRNASVFFTLQNPFTGAKSRLTAFRNSTHIVLFKPSLDRSVISLLAGRVSPKNTKTFHEIYNKAIDDSKPFGYLLIDSGNDEMPQVRYRTNITSMYQNVYIPITD
jgi:hypothetical protein